jgi:hypothetical protein
MRNFILLLIPALWACSPLVVTTDYNRGVTFSDYETFAWVEAVPENAAVASEFSDEKTMKRVMSEVYKEMVLKGYRFSPENPEVRVNIEVVKSEGNTTMENTASSKYWQSFSPVKDNYVPGTLVVELVDSDKNQIIWHGTVKGLLKGSKGQAKIQEGISQMFKKYENPIL